MVELKFERETVQKRLDKIQQWQEKQAPPETEVAPLELSEEAKKGLLNDELKNMQVRNEQKKKQATDWRMQNKELGQKLLMDSSEIDRHIKTLASELNQAHTGFITS
ncbi:hypothetical protein GUITHDRAFT_120803 [Guillardia theta CCMP2712]|uniref:Uncharacterized protein n=1 Tax=Guillardia theta (strain CCMP2712) TaxID=905079 RepID=L1I9W2_GUITC|nr:hypothetical protein GUITHDRAFT_120803 [Guillardia theta CCMP2712]EKX33018.1 hypothetical protein GUITHDRAFT_120803 [Guillardia theta CCMP2712]|eukprot:XP_005819998.1 hypothetical protein GUITHDRAFT_120803 [Guillardia theta CCMP2712]